ncbi:MAG TPA: MoaD/ThiS family protein [Bacteroidetes bacterium]|nr:MoaD/ThiS family protein [Bacteroidota bacterium]
MNIILNNRKEQILGKDRITISELLEIKNFTFKMLVVRINNQPVKKENYDTAVINDGDNVMVLHLISGG